MSALSSPSSSSFSITPSIVASAATVDDGGGDGYEVGGGRETEDSSSSSSSSCCSQLADILSRNWSSSSMADAADSSVGGGSSNSTAMLFHNPVEAPSLLFLGVVGTVLNLVCLAVLSHRKELKLSPDYLFLLRSQCVFDLLYLLTSTPITALPSSVATFTSYAEPYVLCWIFPFVQISMTASIYTTIALAVERYLSVSVLSSSALSSSSSSSRPFPCLATVVAIAASSLAVNLPRFFELEAVEAGVKHDAVRVNNTGVLQQDFQIRSVAIYSIQPAPGFYNVGYFLGYNMVGSFVISLLVPVVILGVFNTLIWCRLRNIFRNRTRRLGLRERRNTRAALSLVVVVIMFFICHSMKLVVSGYQLVHSLITPGVIRHEWPQWVAICTFVSHFLLALNASVNILLFCSCDKRFLVVAQKTLKTWFVWPITTHFCNGGEMMSTNRLGRKSQENNGNGEEDEDDSGTTTVVAGGCGGALIAAVTRDNSSSAAARRNVTTTIEATRVTMVLEESCAPVANVLLNGDCDGENASSSKGQGKESNTWV